MIRRKGQEEMVGFALIVIIVMVVMLVILGILIRQPSSQNSSGTKEIYQLLESMMEYTTNCPDSQDYYDLGNLIEECYINPSKECADSTVCKQANITSTEILDASLKIGEDRVVKGYKFNSYYFDNDVNVSYSVMNVEKGNCSYNIKGSEYVLPVNRFNLQGNIVHQLKLCY
jgi:competence protein ComGC